MCAGTPAGGTTFPGRRAVTSISIRIRGSDSPQAIIVAAGRTSPNARRSTGQHGSKSSARGSM